MLRSKIQEDVIFYNNPALFYTLQILFHQDGPDHQWGHLRNHQCVCVGQTMARLWSDCGLDLKIWLYLIKATKRFWASDSKEAKLGERFQMSDKSIFKVWDVKSEKEKPRSLLNIGSKDIEYLFESIWTVGRTNLNSWQDKWTLNLVRSLVFHCPCMKRLKY